MHVIGSVALEYIFGAGYAVLNGMWIEACFRIAARRFSVLDLRRNHPRRSVQGRKRGWRDVTLEAVFVVAWSLGTRGVINWQFNTEVICKLRGRFVGMEMVNLILI